MVPHVARALPVLAVFRQEPLEHGGGGMSTRGRARGPHIAEIKHTNVPSHRCRLPHSCSYFLIDGPLQVRCPEAGEVYHLYVIGAKGRPPTFADASVEISSRHGGGNRRCISRMIQPDRDATSAASRHPPRHGHAPPRPCRLSRHDAIRGLGLGTPGHIRGCAMDERTKRVLIIPGTVL